MDREEGSLDIRISLDVTDCNGEDIDIPEEWKWMETKCCATVCLLKDLSWYQTYFLDVYNRVGLNNIATHNGIFCGDSSRLFQAMWGCDILGTIVLLSDQYRPGVDVSRSEIRELSLEMACDIMLIQEQLRKEDYWISGFLDVFMKDKSWMIPTSAYHSLLQKRPDLEEHLPVNIGEAFYGCDEIKEQVAQQKMFILSWDPSYLSIDYLHKQLSLAYLKYHYDLRINMTPGSDELYVQEKNGEQLELHSDIFPPSLFLYPEGDCRYLTRDLRGERHFCNATHRFSRFMLENADLLQKKVPGILKELIRTLQEENGEDLISKINDLLNCLRSLPGQPIRIPSDLYLTTEDLYCTQEEDEI